MLLSLSPATWTHGRPHVRVQPTSPNAVHCGYLGKLRTSQVPLGEMPSCLHSVSPTPYEYLFPVPALVSPGRYIPPHLVHPNLPQPTVSLYGLVQGDVSHLGSGSENTRGNEESRNVSQVPVLAQEILCCWGFQVLETLSSTRNSHQRVFCKPVRILGRSICSFLPRDISL